MTYKVEKPITVIAIFLWIGFVCAISCLEAWLKFRAPGVTLAIGLGIGKLVFAALNKIEWFFALTLVLCYKAIFFKTPLLFTTIIILIVQTFWLLPALNARADAIIQNQDITTSWHHYYYAALEVFKTAALFLFGIKLFSKR